MKATRENRTREVIKMVTVPVVVLELDTDEAQLLRRLFGDLGGGYGYKLYLSDYERNERQDTKIRALTQAIYKELPYA